MMYDGKEMIINKFITLAIVPIYSGLEDDLFDSATNATNLANNIIRQKSVFFLNVALLEL